MVAIIALVSVFALPTVSGYFRTSLNSVTRELASSVREAYNATVITGNVHRMVYDIENGRFWVESGPPEKATSSRSPLATPASARERASVCRSLRAGPAERNAGKPEGRVVAVTGLEPMA